MKKAFVIAWALGSLMPAVAGNVGELADSSRVYDLDEVVVVSQSKEFQKLRQQPMSSTVLTREPIPRIYMEEV